MINQELQQKWLDRARASIDARHEIKYVSVVNGSMASLFLSCIINRDDGHNFFESVRLFRHVETQPVSSDFYEGTAGFGWGMNFCCRNKLLPIDETQIMGVLDEILFYEFYKALQRKEYNFFSGAIGYCVYFLERRRSMKDECFLESIVEDLFSHRKEEREYIWRSEEDELDGVIDLGFVHGHGSFILFFSKMIEAGIMADECKRAIYWLVSLYESVAYHNTMGYMELPGYVNDKLAKIDGRMGWQEQLGVAYAISAAASVLHDESLKNLSGALLQKIIFLEDDENVYAESYVYNTLGVAHCLRKISQNIEDPSIMEAFDAWYAGSEEFLEEALDYGFMNEEGEKNIGFLLGMEGVVLLMLGLEGKIDVDGWDECLWF